MRVGLDTFVLGKIPVALLFWKVASGQNVPFSNGLTLGQGYNTYLNEGCRHNVVNISAKSDSSSPQVEVKYQAIQINKYEDLVEILETSAGAAVKASVESGPSASTAASFLDKSSFESSSLTYVVQVDVERQVSSNAAYTLNWNNDPDPAVNYCDRFISDFVKGGALFARVDIKTTDSSKHKELKQEAKAAFSAFAADFELTQSVKTSMTKIEKTSEVHMQFHYVGAPSEREKGVVNGNASDAPQLVQLKNIADDFLARAKDSEWKRRAVLQKYTNVQNWSDQFKVPNYERAKQISMDVHKDSSNYRVMLHDAQQVSPENFVGGNNERKKILEFIAAALSAFGKWVDKVTVDPAAAETLPTIDPSSEYIKTFLGSLQTTNYTVQSFATENHVVTNVIETSLRPGAKKIADAEAFDFNTAPGSIKVAFGKSLQGESYVCLPDQPMAPGYQTVSELWGMKKSTGLFNKPIHVLPIHQAGVIRLSMEDKAPQDTLFTFYTK